MIRMRFDMASESIAQAVLPRVVAAMGAQADLSVARIRDCIAVVDTILARTDGHAVAPGAAVLPGGIEIHVGPGVPASHGPDDAPGDRSATVTVLLCRAPGPGGTTGRPRGPTTCPPGPRSAAGSGSPGPPPRDRRGEV